VLWDLGAFEFITPPPESRAAAPRGGRLLVEHKDLRVLGED